MSKNINEEQLIDVTGGSHIDNIEVEGVTVDKKPGGVSSIEIGDKNGKEQLS